MESSVSDRLVKARLGIEMQAGRGESWSCLERRGKVMQARMGPDCSGMMRHSVVMQVWSGLGGLARSGESMQARRDLVR